MTEETIGDKLRRLREGQKLSKRALGKRAGVTREYISQIEGGKVKTITLRMAKALAKGLDKPPEVFLQNGTYPRPETPEEIVDHLKRVIPQSIPVYTDYPYHAGDGINPTDYVYRRPKLAKKGLEGYLVYGECLEPILGDGDLIIIDREAGIINGDLVACLVDSKLCVARLRKVADELWLETNTSKFKFEDCQMVAPVIEVRRRLK